MKNLICVLFTSLRYEPLPNKVQVITREKLTQIRQDKKKGLYNDWLIERITEKKFYVELERIERENFNQQYDKAIMKKYNVEKSYLANRWFIEQVRPTL